MLFRFAANWFPSQSLNEHTSRFDKNHKSLCVLFWHVCVAKGVFLLLATDIARDEGRTATCMWRAFTHTRTHIYIYTPCQDVIKIMKRLPPVIFFSSGALCSVLIFCADERPLIKRHQFITRHSSMSAAFDSEMSNVLYSLYRSFALASSSHTRSQR